VLAVGDAWVMVDFEGEPLRPMTERSELDLPVRDVAGMLRSFAYARRAAMQHCALQSNEDCSRWDGLMDKWESDTRAMFVATYDAIAREAGLYRSLEEAQPLLALFEVEKALYEVRYELGNRPDWTSIPLRSLTAFTY
jgi:maltose alpha-D-glucosyltransferase/alpha-amylase